MTQSRSSEKISTLALVLLITGAIDSVRNLPATALFGSSLIFFFIFSAIIFLIPVALVSAELSSMWSDDEGGIYSWVRHAFGERLAFLTVWLQWINTMVWCPTILAFIAATLAYLISPELAQNKTYLISIILALFWSLTLISLTGLRASAAFAGFCAIVGMILPMCLIIFLAVVWIIQGKPIAIDLSLNHWLPHINQTQSWVSLTAIMTSFLGMELAAVHVRQVRNPQRHFPRAMLISVIMILFTMILGSLAIAFVIPAQQINLVDGVMQAFEQFFAAYHLAILMPLMVSLLFIGSLGSMINWVVSPAKGLLLAADNGFLPRWFHHKNKRGVASRILIAQAVFVTLLCSGFLLLPSINAIYWLFTSLSTELYMMMYAIMFIAAIRLKYKFADLPRPFAIPGKQYGYYATCLLGLIGCAITLIIGFFSPPDATMDTGGSQNYHIIYATGLILMILPAIIMMAWRKHQINCCG